ncbi:MAG: GNAT family N-acetyltransferase [Pseudomonadales bacterium]|nr:GNAT family N-acetyltransferase [Pseudomonadales bacterium]
MITETIFKTVTWEEQRDQLQRIRTLVFVEEQNVPVELEWDEEDQHALHFLGINNGKSIACARLLPSAQIGRMAVMAPFRNQGIGGAMLMYIIEIAKQQNIAPLFLHAQNHAIPFYEKLGFQVKGDEFMDAGIPYHEMFFVDK